MKKMLLRTISGLALAISLPVYATNFTLPSPNNALIGEVIYAPADSSDNVATVAQRYNIGVNAVVAANPGITDTTVFQNGSTVKISGEFLLPPVPRRGIVVNLPEMRIYYYPANSDQVMTFPVGIGKVGKTIPITLTSITRKVVNPTWTPPADIRQYDRDVLGIDPPKVMPPGPDNPLGPYAIYLRVPTYLIHSTIFPESIGRRASFGCIRMNENDIRQFFPIVQPGIPVEIIDMPNKLAWDNGELYLEAHSPLEERTGAQYANDLDSLLATIQKRLPANHITMVNWQLVSYLTEQPDGVPHSIAVALR